ncbi:PucR family transcriptional regulator [Nocardia donostiensis]|nr:PucR family transcriptional regulator [Nocardia donostiensis]
MEPSSEHRENAGTGPFADWLDRHGEVYFSQLTDDLWEHISEMRAGPEKIRPALRESIISHLPGLKAALEDEMASVDLPGTARDFAGLMARSGLPLSALLRSYELGHAAIWNTFMEYLRSCRDLEVSQRALSLETGSIRMFGYIQTMTGKSIDEYNYVKDRVLREKNSRKNELVREVLAGNGNPDNLEKFLGYKVSGVNIGYVAWVTSADRDAELPELARRALGPLPQQHISIPAQPGTVYGWFSPTQLSDYAELSAVSLPAGLGLAVGAPRHGVHGFRQSHQEATLSATLISGTPARPVRFPDVSVHVLATQNLDLARRFVDDELGQLMRHQDRDRLMPTLRHFLATLGSPSRTAHRLGLHPNTTTQRIQRIESILGVVIDPGNLKLRVAVELAEHVSGQEGMRTADGL